MKRIIVYLLLASLLILPACTPQGEESDSKTSLVPSESGEESELPPGPSDAEKYPTLWIPDAEQIVFSKDFDSPSDAGCYVPGYRYYSSLYFKIHMYEYASGFRNTSLLYDSFCDLVEDNYLYSLCYDLSTCHCELRKLIAAPVSAYCPSSFQSSDPSIYSDIRIHFIVDNIVYSCDWQGNNIEKVYTIDKKNVNRYFLVTNDYNFLMYQYDNSIVECVDLNEGKIIARFVTGSVGTGVDSIAHQASYFKRDDRNGHPIILYTLEDEWMPSWTENGELETGKFENYYLYFLEYDRFYVFSSLAAKEKFLESLPEGPISESFFDTNDSFDAEKYPTLWVPDEEQVVFSITFDSPSTAGYFNNAWDSHSTLTFETNLHEYASKFRNQNKIFDSFCDLVEDNYLYSMCYDLSTCHFEVRKLIAAPVVPGATAYSPNLEHYDSSSYSDVRIRFIANKAVYSCDWRGNNIEKVYTVDRNNVNRYYLTANDYSFLMYQYDNSIVECVDLSEGTIIAHFVAEYVSTGIDLYAQQAPEFKPEVRNGHTLILYTSAWEWIPSWTDSGELAMGEFENYYLYSLEYDKICAFSSPEAREKFLKSIPKGPIPESFFDINS